ncbi:MAG: amidohydrolase family protein [Geminicoccaceae bacterium]
MADTHNHIVDPLRFPIVPGVGYTPRQADEWGTFEQFDAMLGQNAVSNALLVQPSCYGTDNSAMLDAIARSAGRFRGIAVVDIEADDRTLHELADAGIIGVRFNMMQSDRNVFARSGSPALARIRELGWFLAMSRDGALGERLAPRLERSGLLLIVDHHFGLPAPQEGIDQLRLPGPAQGGTVRRQLDRQADGTLPGHACPVRKLPRAAALCGSARRSFRDRQLHLGPDWPYPNGGGRHRYDRLVATSSGNGSEHGGPQERIYWENPARLFGFSPGLG